MLPKSIGDYGGPFIDRVPVSNPRTQLSADKGNRLFEDSAQSTRTALRAIVQFDTVSSGSPTAITHCSVWGSGDGQKPGIVRSGTGVYVVTYAASFLDGLGVTETVSFLFGEPSLIGSVNGYARIASIASNVITVNTFNTSWVANDLVGDYVELFLR